jgi:hypothetical protein
LVIRIVQTFVSLAGGAGFESTRIKSNAPLADGIERFGAYWETRGSFVQSMKVGFPASAVGVSEDEPHAAKARALHSVAVVLAIIKRTPLILRCATDQPLKQKLTFTRRRCRLAGKWHST